ncbi:MAG: hypothetical protein H7A25_00620 [Leptospiraceae bacterium]|nr:hypothetical protein [Leptospiraceae bacterium]MCP5498380.1 hypothetical protein [Leptospiraceae bacterium]
MASDKKMKEVLEDLFYLLESENLDYEYGIIKDFALLRGLSDEMASQVASVIMEDAGEEYDPEENTSRVIIFKKKYKLDKYSLWDKELNESAFDFYEEYRIYPNILTANKFTLNKIDLMANQGSHKENIKSPEMESPEENEFAVLGAFATDDFQIGFYLDEDLKDKEYILIFDSEPGPEDGEEIEEKNLKRRVA